MQTSVAGCLRILSFGDGFKYHMKILSDTVTIIPPWNQFFSSGPTD